jgi:cyclic pyranopterin monophosphate synthase
MSEKLTHLDEQGRARMVDVAAKPVTHRRAVAGGFIAMQPETVDAIADGSVPKGDVLAVARVGAIMAAKRTSDLVPLCHPLSLTHVSVDLEPTRYGGYGVRITAIAETDGKTGVEMEALTAASVAGLIIYDMCKAMDRSMTITDVRLLSKEGGASGTWVREELTG